MWMLALPTSAIPEIEGIFQLLDEEKQVIQITGTMNLRQDLEKHLTTNEEARFFIWEEAPMYTKRESELIQQFLQKHGYGPKDTKTESGITRVGSSIYH
jgi:hypothetical protein